MKNITAIIICYNEEENIAECIESVNWCDQVIAVDSYSTDKTPEIIAKQGAVIYQREWKGFSDQRKFGLTVASNNWVFVLDADERCSDELKKEIQSLNDNDAAGYKIPRKSYFLNKWIKHSGWYPDHKLRLFDKTKISVSDHLVHERYEANGEVKKLDNDLIHYTVRRIGDFIDKINKYSTLAAVEKQSKKKITFTSMLFRPIYSFLREYIFRAGFLDGIHGLMVAYFNMVTNIFTYAKIWELQNKK